MAKSKRPKERTKEAVDWEAVREDFVHSGLSQARIAEKYRVSERALRARRQSGGWERVVPLVRVSRGSVSAEKTSTPQPQPRARARIQARGDIIERLYNLLDAKMSEIENRMAEAGARAASAVEAERDARNLNTLARLYAKLVEMDEAKAQSARKTKAAEKIKDATDADRLRRDLAGRLARLKPGED